MGNRYKLKTKSIMPTDKNTCYICGKYLDKGWRHLHHCIHGTANRAISDKEGLVIWLCSDCHTGGKHAVHRCRATDWMIEQDAQTVWENNYIIKNDATKEEARAAFIGLFGKSYIYD